MAGAIGGIVGSLAGSLVSSVLSGGLGGILNAATSLISQFGGQAVGDALGNLMSGKIGDAIKSVVNGLPLPSFAKDMINGLVDSVIEGSKKDVSPECQCAVDHTFGEVAQEEADLFRSNLENAVKENAEEGQESSKGGAKNWFTILAQALGKTAGQYLDKMVDLQEKMTNLTDKDDAGKMAEAQAEFQAQSQMFKLASEATSTAVKSIGEGLSSMARKQ